MTIEIALGLVIILLFALVFIQFKVIGDLVDKLMSRDYSDYSKAKVLEEQVKKEIEQALFSHFESLSQREREQFEKLEYPKSEKELALIQFANEETSRLMQEAGIEPYDVP